MIEECKLGKHDLIEISRSTDMFHISEVVRWCRNCGSIVIDNEMDGRVNPGQVMKMKFPELFKEKFKS